MRSQHLLDRLERTFEPSLVTTDRFTQIVSLFIFDYFLWSEPRLQKQHILIFLWRALASDALVLWAAVGIAGARIGHTAVVFGRLRGSAQFANTHHDARDKKQNNDPIERRFI